MSNKGKYETRNPVKRALLNRFLARAGASIERTGASCILDVGTGEGLFWQDGQAEKRRVVGVDVRHEALQEAEAAGWVQPVRASAFALPFPDASFDLVVAMEILEHLPRPEDAVAEIRRVSRGRAFVTVPWEPWFSLGVLLGSGEHWRRLGREPEHINAFGPDDITALLSPHFEDVVVTTCAPWLLVEASSSVSSMV